jgi:hypothetical protein
MAITTSQQIARYYDQFQDVEITFTKEIIRAMMLKTKEIYIKCLGYQWPCVIYSASMSGAKIIVSVNKTLNETLRKANNLVSLRLSFNQRDKSDPLAFFVSARVGGFNPYSKEKPELNFVSLTFTQRPPDDLIETLGRILEANVAAKRRKEQRITLTADNTKQLGIQPKNALLYVGNVPRRCLIRDVSFSGAKVIIVGVAKFLVDKEATLRVQLDEPSEAIDIKGKVVRFEEVEGREDLAAVALNFDEEHVPMSYKMRLSNYLKDTKEHKDSVT